MVSSTNSRNPLAQSADSSVHTRVADAPKSQSKVSAPRYKRKRSQKACEKTGVEPLRARVERWQQGVSTALKEQPCDTVDGTSTGAPVHDSEEYFDSDLETTSFAKRRRTSASSQTSVSVTSDVLLVLEKILEGQQSFMKAQKELHEMAMEQMRRSNDIQQRMAYEIVEIVRCARGAGPVPKD